MIFFLSAPTDNRGKNRNGYALEAMGHSVVYFDYRKETKKHGKPTMQKMLIAKVKSAAPDIFFQKAQGPDPEILTAVREYCNFTCCWWFDYRPEFPQWIAEYAENVDYFFTVVKSWEAHHPNITFMPQGFNVFEHPKVRSQGVITDVAFVGGIGGGGYRKKLLQKLYYPLLNQGVTLQVYGYPRVWRDCPFSAGRQVEGESFSSIVNSAHINLGLFPFDQKIRPSGYQSNRIHQTIGAGGFFLTYETESLDLLYTPGKEVETYSQKNPMDIENLCEKILALLGPEKARREKIRKAGYERAMRDHQYDRRFEQILDLMPEDAR